MSEKKPNILLLAEISRNVSIMLEDTRRIKEDIDLIKKALRKEEEKKLQEEEYVKEGWRLW